METYPQPQPVVSQPIRDVLLSNIHTPCMCTTPAWHKTAERVTLRACIVAKMVASVLITPAVSRPMQHPPGEKLVGKADTLSTEGSHLLSATPTSAYHLSPLSTGCFSLE